MLARAASLGVARGLNDCPCRSGKIEVGDWTGAGMYGGGGVGEGGGGEAGGERLGGGGEGEGTVALAGAGSAALLLDFAGRPASSSGSGAGARRFLVRALWEGLEEGCGSNHRPSLVPAGLVLKELRS